MRAMQNGMLAERTDECCTAVPVIGLHGNSAVRYRDQCGQGLDMSALRAPSSLYGLSAVSGGKQGC